MGDGVNIAARLEGICEPARVCLSSAAYDQVRDRVNETFVDLGDKELKNIARPVRVYEVKSAPSGSETSSRHSPVDSPDPLRASIAVLPFTNMSGDAEQEYFADGISEDIITALSKLSQLFVIARNSSFTFKGKNVHIGEVGKSLGVRYVLEGSVRKSGTPGPGDCAAHRRDDRRAPVGRAVRPGPDRHLRGAGRRDGPHRLRTRAQSQRRRPA